MRYGRTGHHDLLLDLIQDFCELVINWHGDDAVIQLTGCCAHQVENLFEEQGDLRVLENLTDCGVFPDVEPCSVFAYQVRP